MHEMSIMQSVIQTITEQATIKGFSKIKNICLDVGKLSCVESEALKFCFEALASSSICDSATLTIIETPALAFCENCNTTSEISRYGETCPLCGGNDLILKAGDKIFIKQIEVEN